MMALFGARLVCHKYGSCPRLLGLSSYKNSVLSAGGPGLGLEQFRMEKQLFISARTMVSSGSGALEPPDCQQRRNDREQKAVPFAVAAAALGSLGKFN